MFRNDEVGRPKPRASLSAKSNHSQLIAVFEMLFLAALPWPLCGHTSVTVPGFVHPPRQSISDRIAQRPSFPASPWANNGPICRRDKVIESVAILQRRAVFATAPAPPFPLAAIAPPRESSSSSSYVYATSGRGLPSQTQQRLMRCNSVAPV